jgi:lipoic acid synthetase
MVLGATCTRNCRFCDVPTGNPGGAIDDDEPDRLAEAVAELGLRYVVLTSVDRDDLPDGGADVFARAIEAIHRLDSDITVEALVPDFSGRRASWERVLSANAAVMGHNLETVRRLTPHLRDRRAGYEQSLDVLEHFARHGISRVKSGLMLGLGERDEEMRDALRDLRAVGVDAVTLGQYLRPSDAAIPVVRYVPPEEFDALAAFARSLGFRSVVAGPLVRSSYHAADAFETS